jgi:hypothetical protein
MFSETGSIMRQRIEDASNYCSAAVEATEKLLETPPTNRKEIGRAIGGLFKSVYRLEASVENLGVTVGSILAEPFEGVRENLNHVELQLDILFDRGSDDPLYFVLQASRLLRLLRHLKQSLDDMEDERKENSKMSRV